MCSRVSAQSEQHPLLCHLTQTLSITAPMHGRLVAHQILLAKTVTVLVLTLVPRSLRSCLSWCAAICSRQH